MWDGLQVGVNWLEVASHRRKTSLRLPNSAGNNYRDKVCSEKNGFVGPASAKIMHKMSSAWK